MFMPHLYSAIINAVHIHGSVLPLYKLANVKPSDRQGYQKKTRNCMYV